MPLSVSIYIFDPMRIISGTHKGRKIHPPGNLPVRPTTDFAKTGLFNILQNNLDFENISVLDLFSGTGNISFEFASRGAMEIVPVDKDSRCFQFIRETAAGLNFSNIKPERSEVFHFLEKCEKQFDVIFADPPFEMKEIEKIPDVIFSRELLNKGGWFIIEHSKRTIFPDTTHFYEKRTYGDVNFSFYKQGDFSGTVNCIK